MAANANMTSVVIHWTALNLIFEVSDGKSRLNTTISLITVSQHRKKQ